MRTRDTLMIWSRDRLSRPIQGLILSAADRQAGKVDFCSLIDGCDTFTPSSVDWASPLAD